MYFVKAPALLKRLFHPDFVWKKDSADAVYFSFDDGPHPVATTFVLDELEKYNAKATFFCIGKNVAEHPHIFQQIKNAGHAAGNHTHTHLNGWKVSTKDYIKNFKDAEQFVESKLFRPPYGKIKPKQAREIQSLGYKIIMWDVLSGDFDTQLSPEKCWENIALNIEPGSIIVFHDSTKAWERLQYTLPRALAFCHQKGWKMEVLR